MVANSRNITKSEEFEESDKLALVDGSIAEAATAARIAEVATNNFNRSMRLTTPASILRNTSRITPLTIFVLSHRSTSKVFS